MAARVEAATGCPEGWDVADLPYRMGGSDLVVLDGPTIDYFHQRGMPVFAWTIDDEKDMSALLAAGVDGIMTDRPDILARVLGRKTAP